jgi:hypothetical protein
MRSLLACIFFITATGSLKAQPCGPLIDTGYLTERQYWAHYLLDQPYSTEPQTFTQKHKITTKDTYGGIATVWVRRQYGKLYLFGEDMHSDEHIYFIPQRYHGKVDFTFSNGETYHYEALPKHFHVSFGVLLQGTEKQVYRLGKNADFKWPKKIKADTALLHKLKSHLLTQIQYTQQYIDDSAGRQILRNTSPVTINYTEEDALRLRQALRCLN